ncbi:MAG: twin-arginine translocase subunit TatC [Candidatus Bathyarchaeota archaeon]
MENQMKIEDESNGWKIFLKNHWNMLVFWIIAAILAMIGVIYVYSWFVEEAQNSSMVPMILGQWSMGNLVTFILHLIFWELLLIGIPIAIVAILGWVWWKKIPDQERQMYQFFGKGSKTQNGGSGISFLFFVAFCIKVYIDGNWDSAISSWTLDYVVNSVITILVWGAIIFGIPAIIIGLIYLGREISKKS